MIKRLKFILLFSFVFTIFLSPFAISAQDSENSPSPTTEESSGIQQKINDLKERLATRVAELKSQNKKAFFGVIKQKNDETLTLLNKDTELEVLYSSDTTISTRSNKGKTTKADTKTLTVGSNAVAFGILDLDKKILTARSITIVDLPTTTVGTVVSVDNKEGTLTMTGEDGNIELDYEISTKCFIYEKDSMKTCGLSKVNENDHVIARMLTDDKDLTKATALRIVVIPITTSK